MDRQYGIEVARRFSDAVKAEFAPCQVILFGSCARGTATEHSDIDIAVVRKTEVKDRIAVGGKLWMLAADIEPNIEPILINELTDSLFHREIKRDGIYIN